MKRLVLVLVAVSLAVALITLAVKLTSAQTPVADSAPTLRAKYFSETGHYVTGPFLDFYEKRGGLDIFGYPISEAVVDESGRLIQFFQRAVMEWHPENPDPYKVQLALLGDLLGHREPPIPVSEIPPPNDPYRHYFPETGHTVGYAFLAFFDTRGGLDIFGYPITELRMENGLIVQYFQRARLEWHPDNPLPYRVQLGLLGTEYAKAKKPDEEWFAPVPTWTPTPTPIPTSTPERSSAAPSGHPETQSATPTPPPIPTLHVRASVKYPIVAPNGPQTVYVRLSDGEELNLEGAKVSFVAHYPGGDKSFDMPATNAKGWSVLTFNIGYVPSGYTIYIEVTIEYQGHSYSKTIRFTVF